MNTLEWDDAKNELTMIDQRLLPGQLKFVSYTQYEQVARAIEDMVVRGAPAIGAAAAYGMALAACRSTARNKSDFINEMMLAGETLRSSRPTAVNLFWAVKRMSGILEKPNLPIPELTRALVSEAKQIALEDIEINLRIARFGAELIDDGDTIIHHCNTGALATVDWGTALGIIRMAFNQGKKIQVLVDETRPRLQGARLTAWELQQYGIPFEIITDGAAGYFLHRGDVQKVLFGADRVAANGDVANKIGTYMLALAAFHNGVPAYSAVPTSTIDLSLANGDLIPIEERSPDEVLGLLYHGEQVAPQGAKARNPAFDVTPHELLSGIITENGVVYPPYDFNLPIAMQIRSQGKSI